MGGTGSNPEDSFDLQCELRYEGLSEAPAAAAPAVVVQPRPFQTHAKTADADAKGRACRLIRQWLQERN